MNNDNEERIQQILDSTPKNKLKAVRNNIHKFIQIYNGFCTRCKSLATSNPKRPMSSYCDDCQTMIKEVMSK